MDYVDVLLLHRDDPRVPVSVIMEFMNELIDLGYTRAIGTSNWTIERFKEANDYALKYHLQPFKVIQNQFSLGVRVNDPWKNNSLSITNASDEERQYYIENNIPIMCYASLGDGFFAGKYDVDSTEFLKSLSSFSKDAYYSKHNLEVLRRTQKLAKEKNISVATLALAYILNQKENMLCVTSVSSISRLEENLMATEIKLSEEEMKYLKVE